MACKQPAAAVRHAVLVASLLCLVPEAGAQPVNVDLTVPPTAFAHFWKRCVGSGHMLLGTRSDWQQHLRRAKDELGFVGIRGHGIFNDDMSVMPRPGVYDFFNVDQVYDYLMELDVTPIVELSFMPLALARCSPGDCKYAFNNHGAYKGLTMPPANFTEWHDLVKALTLHFVERYGLDAVETWRFEVWNELWGMDFPHPYMDLYAASVKAIKAVSPTLKVGGPATMQVLHVADFVQAVQSAGLPFDFVSTHLYPTDPECPTAEGETSCFTRLISEARNIVRKHAPGKEFYITEYNAGLSLKDGRDLDAPFAAAFALRQVAAIEDVDMFSWWTFTDIFEEQWQQSAPFQNGFGLQTIHGVAKPSWRAFQLLKDAGSWRARISGPVSPLDANASLSVLATLDEQSLDAATQLQLFVADWSPASSTRYSCSPAKGQCVHDPQGSYTDFALCNAQCRSLPMAMLVSGNQSAAPPGRQVNITIKHNGLGPLGAPAAEVHATMARIDDTHANAKAEWVRMGRPPYLKRDGIAQLEGASQLVEEAVAVHRSPDGLTSTVIVTLAPYSAARLKITATLASMEAAVVV